MSGLVSCYNRGAYCLVVDELDSGIYEYLLGECIEVMQEKAKGQLILLLIICGIRSLKK